MRTTAMKILILGDHKVGKSAVTVRFLTKRFIGEYFSCVDHVYRSSVRLDDGQTDVEVLDTCSKSNSSGVDERQVNRADALVIVYSICSRQSFNTAQQLFHHLVDRRIPSYLPMLLLGNKRDLEHRREVGWEEGDEVALEQGCQFYEVSAADNALSVSLAFQAFLREVRGMQQQRAALLKRRRGSLGSVSKMLGAMFGKASLTGNKNFHGERRWPLSTKDSHGERRWPLSNSSKDSHGERRWPLSTKDSHGERRWSLSTKDSHSERRWPLSTKDSHGERRWPLSNSNKDSHSERRWPLSTKDSHGERRWSLSTKDSHGERRWSLSTKESHGERKWPLSNSNKDSHSERRWPLSTKDSHDKRRWSLTTKDSDGERRSSLSHSCKDGERRLFHGSKDCHSEPRISPSNSGKYCPKCCPKSSCV